jgi:hypothetical protein
LLIQQCESVGQRRGGGQLIVWDEGSHYF